MKTITKADYSTVGEFTFSAFASDLGLKPGQFPRYLDTVKGFALFRFDYATKDGSHVYRCGLYTFTIFND